MYEQPARPPLAPVSHQKLKTQAIPVPHCASQVARLYVPITQSRVKGIGGAQGSILAGHQAVKSWSQRHQRPGEAPEARGRDSSDLDVTAAWASVTLESSTRIAGLCCLILQPAAALTGLARFQSKA